MNVALSLVGFTTEETAHDVETGALRVIGRNPRGNWDRVLEFTGEDSKGVDVKTADSEIVKVREEMGSETGAEGRTLLLVTPIIVAHRRPPHLHPPPPPFPPQAPSWWSDSNVHNSWLRDTTKYGGGDFSSRRYVDDSGCYVCESTFHPKKEGKEKASIMWKFEQA